MKALSLAIIFTCLTAKAGASEKDLSSESTEIKNEVVIELLNKSHDDKVLPISNDIEGMVRSISDPITKVVMKFAADVPMHQTMHHEPTFTPELMLELNGFARQ